MSKHKKEPQTHQPTAGDPADTAEPSATDRAALEQASSEPSPAAGRAERGEAIDGLQEQLNGAKAELAELKDKYLRTLAENENSRKRLRQQGEEAVARERERILREVLPIVDNLERAVQAARADGGNGQPIVEGVEMVLRAMLDFLKSQGVDQLTSVGKPFDPGFHEAVDQVESEEHPPNTVVHEFHPAYRIGDRLLRAARVTVSKSATGSGGDKKHETAGGPGQNGGENGSANGGPEVETK